MGGGIASGQRDERAQGCLEAEPPTDRTGGQPRVFRGVSAAEQRPIPEGMRNARHGEQGNGPKDRKAHAAGRVSGEREREPDGENGLDGPAGSAPEGLAADLQRRGRQPHEDNVRFPAKVRGAGRAGRAERGRESRPDPGMRGFRSQVAVGKDRDYGADGPAAEGARRAHGEARRAPLEARADHDGGAVRLADGTRGAQQEDFAAGEEEVRDGNGRADGRRRRTVVLFHPAVSHRSLPDEPEGRGAGTGHPAPGCYPEGRKAGSSRRYRRIGGDPVQAEHLRGRTGSHTGEAGGLREGTKNVPRGDADGLPQKRHGRRGFRGPHPRARRGTRGRFGRHGRDQEGPCGNPERLPRRAREGQEGSHGNPERLSRRARGGQERTRSDTGGAGCVQGRARAVPQEVQAGRDPAAGHEALARKDRGEGTGRHEGGGGAGIGSPAQAQRLSAGAQVLQEGAANHGEGQNHGTGCGDEGAGGAADGVRCVPEGTRDLQGGSHGEGQGHEAHRKEAGGGAAGKGR
mmetsp:Transcript_19046/g.44195  ORF Transcript_19046/g.44195 Transcript_19046/m.44195 type:complete len:517 (-) Transcript_19046:1062-2612(-)